MKLGEPLELPLVFAPPPARAKPRDFVQDIVTFREFGKATQELESRATGFKGEAIRVPAFVNEFWTARQRQACSLHEVSYRACFKPQLPRFFIERLTRPSDVVYDPFMGRGTTLLEAALLGRIPAGCDINPLSTVLTHPRLCPPSLEEVAGRLRQIDLDDPADEPEDLLVFYHPRTLRAISSLKKYLCTRRKQGKSDGVDNWIACVALNRLTGHSKGFFSVYTMPPNQAVSVKSQRKINERRQQKPPARDVVAIILKKSRQLTSDLTPAALRTLSEVAGSAQLVTGPADRTPQIEAGSISLVVTSPPFLNVVDYATDNWLRCWFLGIDARSIKLTVPHKLEDWQEAMTAVFAELARVLRPGGHVAFEVGEVLKGELKLEEAVLPCGVAAGLKPLLVLINDQEFTKTANCWGVDNNTRGTNTNRIVVFRKGK